MKGKRKKEHIHFTMGTTKIAPNKSIKYLGIIRDQKPTFDEHIKITSQKTGKRSTMVTHVMQNMRGPGYYKKMVLSGVVCSILLTGASIWCKTADKEIHESTPEKPHREVLLRKTSTYLTASTIALQVITCVPPIDLQISLT